MELIKVAPRWGLLFAFFTALVSWRSYGAEFLELFCLGSQDGAHMG